MGDAVLPGVRGAIGDDPCYVWSSVLLVLDLAGTFAFALNGALTADRVAHLDIVGVITLGMITRVGGGIIRAVLLGALPPATSSTGVTWPWLPAEG